MRVVMERAKLGRYGTVSGYYQVGRSAGWATCTNTLVVIRITWLRDSDDAGRIS